MFLLCFKFMEEVENAEQVSSSSRRKIPADEGPVQLQQDLFRDLTLQQAGDLLPCAAGQIETAAVDHIGVFRDSDQPQEGNTACSVMIACFSRSRRNAGRISVMIVR